jgi:alanine-synthesizing transaminase
MNEFHHVRRLPPYVFEQVNQLKAKARANGADIVDLGMGNPDLPTPDHINEKLIETVGKPRTNRYSASRGINGLRRAQAGYYERRFGVKLNPDTEVVATLGSKEGFANMAQAITAPGDVILVPNPSYPIHAFGFLMAGAAVRSVPCEPGPEFFHALGTRRPAFHSQAAGLGAVLPVQPDRARGRSRFLPGRCLVRASKRSDRPVRPCLFGGLFRRQPATVDPSGARRKDVAVEFTSMSKTYSMAGWRMGFAVGNERLIAALARVKSYLDYGAFTPIQVAATAALNGPQDCVDEMRATYKGPPRRLVDSFARAGWDIPTPGSLDVCLGADP